MQTTMNKPNVLNKLMITLLALSSLWLSSCDKDNEVNTTDEEDDEEETTTTSATRLELTLDSIYLYAQQIYYWSDDLPDYETFAPRSYSANSDNLDNFYEELYALSQYAINPETNKSYEYLAGYSFPKYSFIEENENAGGRVAATQVSYLDGTDDDYGFALTAIAADDIRVRYVVTGSTAYKAGLRRGDRLVEVEGKTVRADSQSDINLIVGAFDEATFNLTIEKTDGSEVETTLVKATYTFDPVFKDTVMEISGVKFGYLAYEMFTSLNNSEDPLQTAFAAFAKSNVTDLILDLRYNGGGYLESADYLLNNIISSDLDNQPMYTEQFNELMQSGDATILENQILTDDYGDPITYRGRNATYLDIDYSEDANTYLFEKDGSLETVQNIYVIITDATASASELIINTLKPYYNVVTIGYQSYGKPVGFFGINIDQYTMYIPNFHTINSLGEGDYYDGFTPDYEADDDVTHDFGDPEETSIAVAVALATGSDLPNARTAVESNYLDIREKDAFSGMIERRRGSLIK